MTKGYSPQIEPNLELAVSDLNIDQVREQQDQTFQHPAGFIQVKLDTPRQSRLHIWPASERVVRSNIHDHIYSFRSRIICGELGHTPYLFGWDQIHGTHELVEAHADRKDRASLQRSNLFYQIYPAKPEIYRPGDEYLFSAFLPHQVAHQKLTATISYKTAVHADKKPLILVPRAATISPAEIPPMTQSQIWELIAEVIDQAKFSRKSEPAPKLH